MTQSTQLEFVIDEDGTMRWGAPDVHPGFFSLTTHEVDEMISRLRELQAQQANFLAREETADKRADLERLITSSRDVLGDDSPVIDILESRLEEMNRIVPSPEPTERLGIYWVYRIDKTKPYGFRTAIVIAPDERTARILALDNAPECGGMHSSMGLKVDLIGTAVSCLAAHRVVLAIGPGWE